MADSLQNPELEEAPVTKKKKVKTAGGGISSGISLPVLFIIIGVTIGILGVAAFIVNNMMISNIIEKKFKQAGMDSTTAITKLQEDNEIYAKKLAEKMKLHEMMKKMEEEDFYMGEEGIEYAETSRLLNNPKNSSEVVVCQLGFEYRIFKEHVEGEEAAEEEGEGEGEGKEAVKPDHFFTQNPKISAKVKATVNDMFSRMTIEEIQTARSELSDKLFEEFKPIFKKEKLWLKKVIVIEFLVQE